MLQVLNEQVGHITESRRVSKPGVLREMEGIFSVSDRVSLSDNRNNRLYSENLLRNKILNSPQTQEKMNKKCLLGEADHPADRLEVRINEVSHRVAEMYYEDGYIKGRIEVLDTPSGRIVDTLSEAGVQIGISSRAEGSLKDEGSKKRVNENDYFFHTYDLVLNPGFASSVLSPVLESVAENSSTLKTMEEQVGILIEEETNLSTLNVYESVLRSIGSSVLNPLLEKLEEKKDSLQVSSPKEIEIPAHTLGLIESLYREQKESNEEIESLQKQLKQKNFQNTFSEDKELLAQELAVSEGFLKEAEQVSFHFKEKVEELEEELESTRKFRSRNLNSQRKINELEVGLKEKEEELEIIFQERAELESKLEERKREFEEGLNESNRNYEFLEKRSLILLELLTTHEEDFLAECLEFSRGLNESLVEKLKSGSKFFYDTKENVVEENRKTVSNKTTLNQLEENIEEKTVESNFLGGDNVFEHGLSDKKPFKNSSNSNKLEKKGVKTNQILFESQPVKVVSSKEDFQAENALGLPSGHMSKFSRLFTSLSSG